MNPADLGKSSTNDQVVETVTVDVAGAGYCPSHRGNGCAPIEAVELRAIGTREYECRSGVRQATEIGTLRTHDEICDAISIDIA